MTGYLQGPTENTILGDIPQLDFDPPVSISPNKFKNAPLETSWLPTSPGIEPGPGPLLLPEQDVIDTSLGTYVSRDEYQDTIVCAVALELVMNYNTKNLSISELDMRLRCGYRSARFQWEGCRVDNHVLFAVLAEVMR